MIKQWIGAILSAVVAMTVAQGCTLFGAAGRDFVSGGVLVAKTRDEHPGMQRFAVVRPESGYAYLGLFTGRKQRFNMGVNEKGLVVARSTAGSIPKEKRLAYPRFEKDGLQGPDYIARHFASVEEVLSHLEVFSEPVNYILADRREVAVIEVLPGGKTTVRRTQNGTLAHTNHYIEEASVSFNESIGRSSRTRLMRINALLSSATKPLSQQDFIRMTQDRHDGPVNSIWRVGTKPNGVQTLGAMVVDLPHHGNPRLYMTWRTDPADPRSMQTISREIRAEDFREFSQK